MVAVAKKKIIDPLFGQRLRSLRESAGMTLVELGSRAGLTYQEVGRFERAEREPTWATFVKLANALGARLDDFRDDASDVQPDPEADPVPRFTGKRK